MPTGLVPGAPGLLHLETWESITAKETRQDVSLRQNAKWTEMNNGQTHFQHQDWLGTERLRTSYNGTTEGGFFSLPFGDALSASGTDGDAYHLAGLDHDSTSDTDHAQFRQYSPTQGRWLSPDPYSGSYDITNPQSLNRYAYVLNSPMAYLDALGLEAENAQCSVDSSGNVTCVLQGGQTVSVSAGLGDIPVYSDDTMEAVITFEPVNLANIGGAPSNPKACSAYSATGTATYYNLPGKTASGAPFNPNTMNAAMFQPGVVNIGDMMRVSLLNSPFTSVTVTVNDTGPFLRGPNGRAVHPLQPDPNHLIDLTPKAFVNLTGSRTAGHVPVSVTRVCQ